MRAKYMTMVPMYNQYIKYFDNIRLIQDFITRDAENNNVSIKSVPIAIAVIMVLCLCGWDSSFYLCVHYRYHWWTTQMLI